MDEGLKQKFDILCNDLGLTITTAITIFAKAAVRQQKIPFEISLDIPNAETIEAIKEVQEMKKNPSLGKTYTNVEEMIKEVLSDV